MARRRNVAEDTQTRLLLIEAAVQLLREEGQTAVSCRRLALKTGLSHQIVHYYFRSMEELFLEVIKRACEKRIEHYLQAAEADQPLWVQWEQFNEKGGVQLEMEYMVLANRYPKVRAELARYRTRFRDVQTKCLAALFERYKVDTEVCPPAVMAVIMNSVSRTMVLEESLGATAAHAETYKFIENFLTQVEGPRKKSKTATVRRKQSKSELV